MGTSRESARGGRSFFLGGGFLGGREEEDGSDAPLGRSLRRWWPPFSCSRHCCRQLQVKPTACAVSIDDEAPLTILDTLFFPWDPWNGTTAVGTTLLHTVAGTGSAVTVKALLNAGNKVEAARDDGCTVLHWTARGRSSDVIQAILDAHADVDVAGKDGGMALHWEEWSGGAATVQTLLGAGADVGRAGKEESTALPLVRSRGVCDPMQW